MLRFGVVGFAGLLVNLTVVYVLRPFLLLQLCGVAAFIAAATATWILNRNYTFAEAKDAKRPNAARQWLLFLAVNGVGGVVYLGTFSGLTSFSPLCHRVPAIAVCAGSALGMVFNFALSKRLVFKTAASPA
jgi:putative flippase GtrA